jgi:hypothetical protein
MPLQTAADKALELEREAGPSASYHELAEVFRKVVRELDASDQRAQFLTWENWLYEYQLKSSNRDRARGDEFSAHIEFPDGRRHPPHVSDFPAAATDYFRHRLQAAESPSARARLANFLWLRTRELPLAELALTEYLSAAQAVRSSRFGDMIATDIPKIPANRKGKNMKLFPAMLLAFSILLLGRAHAGPEEDVRASFDRFIVAQNAHDIGAVRELLLDAPTFLWITRGTPVWGREPALKRFEALYQGTWKLAPDASGLRVTLLSDATAQLYVPIMFNIGAPGQPAPDAPFLMNQTWVKTTAGWRIANILPIPVPPPAAAPVK